jgi:anti-sigma B factor antagonist
MEMPLIEPVERVEQIEPDPVVLKITTARLDVVSSPGVKKHLVKLIGVGRKRIVLDLCEVTSIDSSGLSTLVFAHKLLSRGGSLAISCPRDTIMSMLKLTRLVHVLSVFASREQAIKSLLPTLATHTAEGNQVVNQ